MRTLGTTLTNKQRAVAKGSNVGSETPLGAVYIEVNLPTYSHPTKGSIDAVTWTVSDILSIEHNEDPWGAPQDQADCVVVINDPSHGERDADYRGRLLWIKYGYTTTAGNETSTSPPLWVTRQRNTSRPGQMTVVLYCIGLMTKMRHLIVMGEEVGAAPAWEQGAANEAVIFNAADGILDQLWVDTPVSGTIVDSTGGNDVGSADTSGLLYKPTVVTQVNDTYRNILRGLMSLTGSSIRPTNDSTGKQIELIWTQDSSPSADYTYSAAADHPPIETVEDQAVNLPNRYIAVDVAPNENATAHLYTGVWNDIAHSDPTEFGLATIIVQHPAIGSDAEAAEIATSVGTRNSRETPLGSMNAHMNCGQEIYDYVTYTDPISGDTVSGWVRGITRRYQPGVYNIEIRMGGLAVSHLMTWFQQFSRGMKSYYVAQAQARAAQYAAREGLELPEPSPEYMSFARRLQAEYEKLAFSLLEEEEFGPLVGRTTRLTERTTRLTDAEIASLPRLQIQEGGMTPLPADQAMIEASLRQGMSYPQAIAATYGSTGEEINDDLLLHSPHPPLLATGSAVPFVDMLNHGRYWGTPNIPHKAIRSAHITTDQIVAKDFRTDWNVGEDGGPTGIRITSAEIAGYVTGTPSVKQFYAQSSDGKLYAGGGAVVLDSSGITVEGQTVIFKDTTPTTVGWIYGSSSVFKLLGANNINVTVGAQGTGDLYLDGDPIFIQGVSGVVVNESGLDSDFRVEGDNEGNLIFVDASVDKVGFGIASPAERVHIANGNLKLTGAGATVKAAGYEIADGNAGADGSFTAGSGETVTVEKGIITSIV